MRRTVTALLIALALAACGQSGDVTSSTSLTTAPPETTAPPTTADPPPETTTTAAEWDRPDVCDCPDVIAAAIPVGDEGVSYRNVGAEEIEPSGPSALEIDASGRFVVLDTPGQGVVLATADAFTRVPLNWEGIQALIDIQPTSSGFLVLDLPFGNDQPRLIDLDHDAGVNTIVSMPDGLWLDNGLTGIALGPNDEIWVELEFGNRVAEVSLGSEEYVVFEGYPYARGLYRPMTFLELTIMFMAGDVTVEVENELGGTMTGQVVGVNPDESFVVWTIELTQDDEGILHTREQVLWFDADGTLIATARLPRDEQFIYVPLPVTLGPDGIVYYLQTSENEVHILELGWHTPSD